MDNEADSRRKPFHLCMYQRIGLLTVTFTHWYQHCIIRTHHSCAPPATSYHTQYATCLVPSPRKLCLSLNTNPIISFWKIPRNPTFSVPSEHQSPTLLGSNLGTNPYVPHPLWNLLLSNSHLFSPGHTLSPRFLSLGNTCRVPVTRPPETTSRSNSPVYPQQFRTGRSQGNLARTPDVAVVIPLNNPAGPEGDTVTAENCSTKH